ELNRAVSVIDLDTNREILSNTIFDYLRTDPSLDVRARAPDGLSTDLSIRGADFGQTLVLLNGIRMNDSQTGHFNLDIPLPPDALSRVEILKGTGSAMYGTDAVGGVVNLITKPPESSELSLRTAIGNFGVNQQSASLATVWKRVTERLMFSRDFSTGFEDDRDYRNLSFASLTHALTSLGATDVTLAYNDRPYGANQFYGPYNAWERTRSWFAALRQSFGKNTEASFSFRRHTDLFVLFRDNPALYTNHHSTENYEAALRRHNSLGLNTTISYGGEAYRDEIDSNNLGYHQRNRGSAYVALEMRALKRYSFTLGAREEIYGGGARQFNPTASAGVWLSPHWKLRASAGRAFRLPSYTDLYYSDPTDFGSPYLKPESAWSYDGAAEWSNGGRIRGSIGVFYRRLRNGIDFVRSSESDPWVAANIDRINFTGAEASLTVRAGRAQLIELNYTALHGSQDALNGRQTKYSFSYPSSNGSISWEGSLPGGFLARTRAGVLQRFEQSPYTLWDVYLANRRGRLTPFAQFTNLLDTSYQELLGVDMPGRAAIVGLEWRLHY
ncbi:MAG TPA: TonB-dependent receptor, partial [Bryobacteraceae bacterium]|nr:TonB-dependent receptor [Bryobacteraceae bacterium]